MTAPLIGQGVDRVDGGQKVTGSARYTADHPVTNVAYAVCVGSPVARGRINSLQTDAAEAVSGVLAVITHRNRPKIHQPHGAVETLLALDGEEIHYSGQVVAVVVAETWEAAKQAAGLVWVDVARQPPVIGVEEHLARAFPPKNGWPGLSGTRLAPGMASLDAALGAAEVRIAAVYRTPIEHHNPMEPHATLAQWEGDRLILFDATQGILDTRGAVAQALGIAEDRVTVLCPFVGGGFGCKGAVWMHTVLAALAARVVKRPVKLELSRQQMFETVGHRPATRHEMALGAKRDGTLVALRHRHVNHSSPMGEYVEPSAGTSRMLYDVPNCEWEHKLVDVDLGAPIWTRAPGDTPGTFALESAMDELAYALRIDPIALRLRNHADSDRESGHPYSAKHLKECYALGAERFGWQRRPAEPGTQRREGWRIGQGMAGAVFPGLRSRASARVRILADGSAEVASATHDLGTGMYTIMTQVAAETLGLTLAKVTAQLGDSSFPYAPGAGGSQSTASVLPAVQAAARQALDQLIALGLADSESPIFGLKAEEVVFEDGRLAARADPLRGETLRSLFGRLGLPAVEATATTAPGEEGRKWEFSSFGAHFVEVAVDEWTAETRIRRVVSVMDVGRVINAKTARSQILGGVVWGIGMALMEESIVDRKTGRIVTANLADYRVPVNADVPEIEVLFIDKPDLELNPLGARGMGEVGMTGVAAAIANAVYHATGKRVRDLPITPEKLL